MNNFIKILISFVLVLFFSFTFLEKSFAQNFDYEDVIFYNDDKIETIALHKGSYILMKIWATWCPYCKQQLPAFSLLKNKFKDNENVKFIALSIDEGGFQVADRYFKQQNLKNLEVYHDREKNLFRALGLRGIPTILLISPEGNIIKTYNNMRYLNIEYLEKLFNGKKA